MTISPLTLDLAFRGSRYRMANFRSFIHWYLMFLKMLAQSKGFPVTRKLKLVLHVTLCFVDKEYFMKQRFLSKRMMSSIGLLT